MCCTYMYIHTCTCMYVVCTHNTGHARIMYTHIMITHTTCIHIHIRTHTHTHTHTDTCIHTCTHPHTHTHTLYNSQTFPLLRSCIAKSITVVIPVTESFTGIISCVDVRVAPDIEPKVGSNREPIAHDEKEKR